MIDINKRLYSDKQQEKLSGVRNNFQKVSQRSSTLPEKSKVCPASLMKTQGSIAEVIPRFPKRFTNMETLLLLFSTCVLLYTKHKKLERLSRSPDHQKKIHHIQLMLISHHFKVNREAHLCCQQLTN